MSDEKKFDYGTASSYQGKYYHRPGYAAIAEQIAAERRRREANAPVVLRKKHLTLGGIHYTFFVLQKRYSKPYLQVSMMSERLDTRGTVSIPAPYVPTFVSLLAQIAKGLE